MIGLPLHSEPSDSTCPNDSGFVLNVCTSLTPNLMGHDTVTPNSMAPALTAFPFSDAPQTPVSSSHLSSLEAMSAVETTYSNNEGFETAGVCELFRGQESMGETRVIKVLIRKPMNEDVNELSTTGLEMTGEKSVVRELVVRKQTFPIPKSQIADGFSKSTKKACSSDSGKAMWIAHPKSTYLKEGFDSANESSVILASPYISDALPQLQPRVLQGKNIPSNSSRRSCTSVREQSSLANTSSGPGLVDISFPKRPPPSRPLWCEARLPTKTDIFVNPAGIAKKQYIVHEPFVDGRSNPSWAFLLQRPMYNEIMAVKPIPPINMLPRCSDVSFGFPKTCPLEIYLTSRSKRRRFVCTAMTEPTGARAASGIRYRSQIHVRPRALNTETFKLMTGHPLIGNIAVQSEIDRTRPPTQSPSKLKMPAALKENECIYPFKLIPSPAEQRPLETSKPPPSITKISGYLDCYN